MLDSILAFFKTDVGVAVLGLVILVDHSLAASDKFKNSSFIQLVLDLLGKGLALLQSAVAPPKA